MKSIIILGLAMTSMLLFACGQIPVDNNRIEINNFPLTSGNRWVYLNAHYEISYNPTVRPDTFRTMTVRHVLGLDSTINSQVLVMVDDSTSLIDSSPILVPYYKRYWWKVENGNLLEYAYLRDDIGHISSPTIYPEPRVVLDFPLTIGKRWVVAYTEYDPPFTELIVDSVLAIERLDYAHQFFACAKIKSMLSIAPDFVYYEWYSNEGLISEKFDFGKQYRTNEVGHIIDSVYVYNETRLLEIDLID
jgi:hypothetical protein